MARAAVVGGQRDPLQTVARGPLGDGPGGHQVQVARCVDVRPAATEHAELKCLRVRDRGDEHAAWAQVRRGGRQQRARVGQVLERVPQHDRVTRRLVGERAFGGRGLDRIDADDGAQVRDARGVELEAADVEAVARGKPRERAEARADLHQPAAAALRLDGVELVVLARLHRVERGERR